MITVGSGGVPGGNCRSSGSGLDRPPSPSGRAPRPRRPSARSISSALRDTGSSLRLAAATGASVSSSPLASRRANTPGAGAATTSAGTGKASAAGLGMLAASTAGASVGGGAGGRRGGAKVAFGSTSSACSTLPKKSPTTSSALWAPWPQ